MRTRREVRDDDVIESLDRFKENLLDSCGYG